MNMGARGSITPPEIVKTPNRPALWSENIVTKVGGKFLISPYPLSLSLGGRPVVFISYQPKTDKFSHFPIFMKGDSARITFGCKLNSFLCHVMDTSIPESR